MKDGIRNKERSGSNANNLIFYDHVSVVELVDTKTKIKMIGLILTLEGQEVTIPFKHELALKLYGAMGEMLKVIGDGQVLAGSN